MKSEKMTPEQAQTVADRMAELDRRIAERKAEDRKEKMQIKKYANLCLWTDIEPYEVVRKISDICVEVRPMKTKQIEFPQQFFPGGFVGHFADNRSGQKYEYISDDTAPVMRIRWSEAKMRWQGNNSRFAMADAPYKFYDYNF